MDQKRSKGAVSMFTILVLGMIALEVALVGLSSSFLSGEQGLGMRASHIALYAAHSGINDVLMRIVRNKAFVPSPNPYELSASGGSVSVQVSRTIPDAGHIQYVIVSTGSSGSKRIKITDTVLIDNSDGSLLSQYIQEGGL